MIGIRGRRHALRNNLCLDLHNLGCGVAIAVAEFVQPYHGARAETTSDGVVLFSICVCLPIVRTVRTTRIIEIGMSFRVCCLKAKSKPASSKSAGHLCCRPEGDATCMPKHFSLNATNSWIYSCLLRSCCEQERVLNDWA